MQNNQKMNLVLSSDAKPRLKWTPELHQRFADAINQLGGADKATPKSLMRVMGIPGLTLYHLKSHLQKYRLGKSQHTEICINNNQEQYSRGEQSSDGDVDDGSQNPAVNDFKIAEALQIQMEVQKKLHEQIEVQRHLQLRIEAQGKYLQSVLLKAQETLAGYTCSSSSGVELIKAELSQVMSMVNTGCTSSSFSELTEAAAGGLSSKDMVETNKTRGAVCSIESSLTMSSESSGRKDQEKQLTSHENGDPIELPLMDVHTPENKPWNGSRRRSGSTISDGVSNEQPSAKKLQIEVKGSDRLRKSGFLGTFDLNSQYQNDGESDLDLNTKDMELELELNQSN